MSCTEITTTDDGINKIGKLTIDNDGDVVRIKTSTTNILSHNTANTNTVLTAGNELYFSAGGSIVSRLSTTGLKLGTGGATEKLDVGGNAVISGELTAPTVKHSDDFCRFYLSVNTPFNSAQTSYTAAFNVDTLTSTKITKNAANNRFTINKAGYYKVAANMVYENTTYQNRVVYRGEISINGNLSHAYGDSFVYVRDSRYGDYGTGFVTTVVNLAVNDYVEIYVTLKKDQSQFGAEMSGTQVRFRSAVDFEYLGT